MDNQHKKIKGYRDLSEEEITAMNNAKALGSQCEAVLAKLSAIPNIDQESLMEARTNLKQGIMWAVRSVAKPDSF